MLSLATAENKCCARFRHQSWHSYMTQLHMCNHSHTNTHTHTETHRDTSHAADDTLHAGQSLLLQVPFIAMIVSNSLWWASCLNDMTAVTLCHMCDSWYRRNYTVVAVSKVTTVLSIIRLWRAFANVPTSTVVVWLSWVRLPFCYDNHECASFRYAYTYMPRLFGSNFTQK